MLDDLMSTLPKEDCSEQRIAKLCLQFPSLQQFRKNYVAEILELTGDNYAETAKVLGVSYSTIYRWVSSNDPYYGLKSEEE